jgi:RecJ-like exonuclease
MNGQKNVRHYTCMLLDMIDEGFINAKDVVDMFTSFCSEQEVYDMMKYNELLYDTCQNCDVMEELNDNGLCEDCQAEEDITYCDSCDEETNEEELSNNNGLCDNCMDAEREQL